ncbi:MAG: alpha-glycosidase, partial [Clostridia bacterium]|nr:alpha-glycosidase [Clostridia bacterium]
MGINIAALFHRSAMEYRYFYDSKLYLRLRTAADDVERATVLYGHRYLPLDLFPQKEAEMTKIASDGVNDWWEASFTPDEPRVQYEFRVQKGEETHYYCEIGIYDHIVVNKAGTNNLNGFVHPHILNCDEISIPDWARGAVVYQIFPDRFNRIGEREPNMVPWGTKPDRRMFAGGNLAGIREKVPYLKELGVDILYMTPIFEAGSNHRYDTIDYLKIDPMLGTEQDFKDLVDTCHSYGMHVVLDGVFNHCSPKFFAFRDICEKGKDSEYADWFFPHSYPVSFEKGNYDTFSHGAGMPKLNMESKSARAYFLHVLTYWIEKCGVDGWRLDVANEIDKGFLREMRTTLKETKPDVLIIGEVWTDAGEWLQGDMFDGVMHYQMTFPIRQSWEADSEITDMEFYHRIQMASVLYQHGVAQASWIMLDSHDTSRMATVAGSKERFLAAAFLQFTLPGAPFIYYGDEVGLEGGDDPD